MARTIQALCSKRPCSACWRLASINFQVVVPKSLMMMCEAVICNGKESSQEYLDIHATVHEAWPCRQLHDAFWHRRKPRATCGAHAPPSGVADAAGGFQCFVPYPFLPDDTRLPEAQLATGAEVLRTIAVSRLMLDTIPHIQGLPNERWRLALVNSALRFGADDIDGTVHENPSCISLAQRPPWMRIDDEWLA